MNKNVRIAKELVKLAKILSQEQRDDAVYYMEDKMKSIETAIENIKRGSDVEKGYLL